MMTAGAVRPIQISNSQYAVIASASEAIHLAAKEEWIASSQVLLAMTPTHTLAFLRHDVPEFCEILTLLQNRGRRECRALVAPAASHAK